MTDQRPPGGPPAADLFTGSGGMEPLMRGYDWDRSPVGPVAGWPAGLRTAVRIVLTSRYAMWMGWGPGLTFFYNDAYARMTLGAKHPWALGRSAREVWAEIWADIGPRAESVLATGVATWDEGLRLFLERGGHPEETYHTFSYSPLPDDGGGVGGMLCVVTEDTDRVIGDRRLSFLRELAAELASTRTEDDVLAAVGHRVAARDQDLPFALLYLVDGPGENGGTSARLACASGVTVGTPAAPATIDLSAADAPWPVAAVLAGHAPVVVDDLAAHFPDLPTGPWGVPPRQAVAVPIARPGQERPAGVLVAAANPYRPLDADYRGFLDLLAGQIAAGLAGARTYEAERRRAEALAELDRAKTAFFSNVSHEFRTPLTLLLGPVEDVLGDERDPPTNTQRERLGVVHRNALRLQKLVNTLLDFSRIEAGRVRARYEPVDLAAFTAELASNFRSACDRAGLELVVDCPPLPAPVSVDRDMWEKVVLNLVSNAFKFTLAGRIEVRLRAAGPRAVLTVRDTGAGIPAAELPRVFDRFHRVEGTVGRTQEGTGIGLALVQELARLHGGEAHAESEEGVGSTFTVTVPFGTAHLPPDQLGTPTGLTPTAVGAAAFVEEALRWLPGGAGVGDQWPVASPSERDNATASYAPSSQATDHRTPATVLLADDNADMREYVARLLAGRYEVTAVPDGLRALAAARAAPPDLILSDVMMPGLDGFGLLREVRADRRVRDVPVVLLSARAGEEARVEGLAAGADDYLTKPFSAKELLARVDGVLELARLRRESAAALRANQERLHVALDAAHAGTYRWDPRTNTYLDFDDSLKRVFGLPPGERVVGPEPILARTHPGDLPLLADVIERAGRGEDIEVEFRVLRPGGEVRWVLNRARPILGDDGRPRYLVGACTDVTKRRRVEEALREADKRKDEFLAMLAHELRNPLAPVRNALEVMRQPGTAGPAASKAREMAERQVLHMARLLDDLLDVSRINRGKIELRTEPVDLAVLIGRTAEAARSVLEERRHRLTVSLAPGPLAVSGDPTRLEQVLANLLNNAAKYTDPGGTVTVTAAPEDGSVVVRVGDTGVGIPAGMEEKIFDLFVQAERRMDRSQGGIGIGLTLVRRLVELHGGTITAHSPGPGRGSEFVIRLPAAAPAPAAPTPAAPADHTTPTPASRRVLVVDDNQDGADSLAVLLELAGHEVRAAYDGPAGLAAARAFHPDAVLLDIGMPGMDGYEVARRLRADPALRPALVVALTGWGQADDRRRSTEAGFDRHLVKPFDPAALLDLIATAPTAHTPPVP